MGSGMTPPSTENPLLLPDGTRLMHIGPPKTGTTALQYAFHATRPECRAQGVHYAGVTHQPARAARAAMGIKDPLLGKPPSRLYWRMLLWEVRRASERCVLISSEAFAQAPPAAIREIVTDLDPNRIHVVVTLRPLVRVLAPQWQQAVQNGLRQSYDPWLEAVFDEPSSSPARSFWLRHRHDELIGRWAEVVGTENMTVVALDGGDHARVLRVFEQLVGLRQGTLPSIDDATNRSLTLPEAEVVKAINLRFREENLAPGILKQLVTFGAAAYMKRLDPDRDEQRIVLPSWAADRAHAVAASMMQSIAASGVRVVGNLDGLVEVTPSKAGGGGPAPAATPSMAQVTVPSRAAAAAAIGVVLQSGHGRASTDGAAASRPPIGTTDDPAPAPPQSALGSPELDLGSSLYLLAVIANRGRNAVAAWIHRVGNAIGGRPRRPPGVIADGRTGSSDRTG
jgi:hypothetical protein